MLPEPRGRSDTAARPGPFQRQLLQQTVAPRPTLSGMVAKPTFPFGSPAIVAITSIG